MAPNILQKNKRKPSFWSSQQKWSAKLGRQLFGQVWPKILCTPKNLLAPTPMFRRNTCAYVSS